MGEGRAFADGPVEVIPDREIVHRRLRVHREGLLDPWQLFGGAEAGAGGAGVGGARRQRFRRVQVLQGDRPAVAGQRAFRAPYQVFRLRDGRAAGDLHVHHAAVLAGEDDLHVIFAVAHGADALEVAPLRLHRRAEEAQAVIHDVRAPVEQQAAAEFHQRLPIVAAGVPGAPQLDLVDVAEQAALDDVAHVVEGRLEAAVVADIQAVAVRRGDLEQRLRLRVAGAHRLFLEDVFSRLQRHLRMPEMVGRTRGHVDHLHVRVYEHVFDTLVDRAAVALLHHRPPVGEKVAGGDECKLVLVAGQLRTVHAPTGAADAEEADANRIR